MKKIFTLLFMAATFATHAQLSRPVLEDATTIFDCLNKDYRQNNDDLTAFSEAGKDLERIMGIMEYYIYTQNPNYKNIGVSHLDKYDTTIFYRNIRSNKKYFEDIKILQYNINVMFTEEALNINPADKNLQYYKHAPIFNEIEKNTSEFILLSLSYKDDIKKIKSKIISTDYAIDRIKPTIPQSKTNHSPELVLALEKNKEILTKTMNYLNYLRIYRRIEYLDSIITQDQLYKEIDMDMDLADAYDINKNKIIITNSIDINNFFVLYSLPTSFDLSNYPIIKYGKSGQRYAINQIIIENINGKSILKINHINGIENFAEFRDSRSEETINNTLQNKIHQYDKMRPKLVGVLSLLKNHYSPYKLSPDKIYSIASFNQKSFTALAGDALFSVMVEGLTEVIKDRINNELATALVQSLVKVNSGKSDDSTMLYMLNSLMPKTMDFLQTDPGALLTNPSVISTYVKNDLSDLVNNLVNMRNDDHFDEFLTMLKLDDTKKYLVIDGLNTFNLINKSATINEFLWEISKFKSWKDSTLYIDGISMQSHISGFSLLADALMVRSGSNNFTFASYDYFINYYSAKDFRTIYHYFLSVQNEAYYNSSPIITYVTKNDSINDYLLKTLESYNKISNLHAQVLVAKKANDKEKLPIYIGDYATALSDLVYNGVKDCPAIKNKTVVQELYNYTESVKEIISVYRDINQKRYITAVNTALKLPLRYLGGDTVKLIENNVFAHRRRELKKVKNKTTADFIIIKSEYEISKLIDTLNYCNKILDTYTSCYDYEINDLIKAVENHSNVDSDKKNIEEKYFKKNKKFDDLIERLFYYITISDEKNIQIEKNKLKKECYTLQFYQYNVELVLNTIKSKEHRNLILHKYITMLDYLNKPISFILEMSQVQNKDDAKKIIKEFSLGTGSYKANRQNLFTVNLQAYPGYIYGITLGKNIPKAFGLTLPVGVSLNFGIPYRGLKPMKNPNDFFSASVMFGIVDLTAPLILSQNGNADSLIKKTALRQLTPQNIISPSIYATLGIPRTPLVIKTGIQYTPDLSIIDQPGGAFRVNLGIAVDIPLFRFKVIPFKKW